LRVRGPVPAVSTTRRHTEICAQWVSAEVGLHPVPWRRRPRRSPAVGWIDHEKAPDRSRGRR